MSEASSILIETMRCLGFVMCARRKRAACHSLWFVEPCSRGRAHTQWARTHGAPTSRSPIGLGNDPSRNWQLHTEYSAVGPVTAFCPHSAGEAGRGSVMLRRRCACATGTPPCRQLPGYASAGHGPAQGFGLLGGHLRGPVVAHRNLSRIRCAGARMPWPCAESWPPGHDRRLLLLGRSGLVVSLMALFRQRIRDRRRSGPRSGYVAGRAGPCGT